MTVEFQAFEFHADQSLVRADFTLEGDAQSGWRLTRNGATSLEVGPGYRLLRSQSCGVCSTDLARAFLPFPLPQITGHEVLALDDSGARYAVAINASHWARGLDDAGCPFCDNGLPEHCPERLVLGIHDLPGGFGPYILAPVRAMHRLPDAVPDDAAVLIEPLAAALNAANRIDLRPGDSVAVLGPRKLGLLVIAALDAVRGQKDLDIEIVALARRPKLLELAAALGADRTVDVSSGAPEAAFDIVIDTTGAPEGLETAIRAARREVHLKSTNGRPAAGMEHLTELVVDELSILPYAEDAIGEEQFTGWIAAAAPPPNVEIRAENAAALQRELTRARPQMPRVDAAVADSRQAVIELIRPSADSELSPVRPRGAIYLKGRHEGPLLEAVSTRGLRLTSSRCGDFNQAIALIEAEPKLLGLGARMITHRFGGDQVPQAFEAARSRDCIKAVVTHPLE